MAKLCLKEFFIVPVTFVLKYLSLRLKLETIIWNNYYSC